MRRFSPQLFGQKGGVLAIADSLSAIASEMSSPSKNSLAILQYSNDCILGLVIREIFTAICLQEGVR